MKSCFFKYTKEKKLLYFYQARKIKACKCVSLYGKKKMHASVASGHFNGLKLVKDLYEHIKAKYELYTAYLVSMFGKKRRLTISFSELPVVSAFF